MQVAIGVVSAVMWMIENPKAGLRLADDIPHDYVMKISAPYLGGLPSVQSDWTPAKNYQIFFKENPEANLDMKNLWCYQNFAFRP